MIKRNQGSIAVGAFVLLAAGLALEGCEAGSSQRHEPGAAQAAKGRAELWAQNCARCHNMRLPSSYSASEWEVTVHHMRVRANLTAEEQVAITEFLKANTQ